MLTDKAVEMLHQTVSNMKTINEHYQPANGTDSKEHQTIRVMAQSIAFLCQLAREINEKEKEALKEQEDLEKYMAQIFGKGGRAS